MNTSPSLPLGLYRLARGDPAPGSLVLACPPWGAARLARGRGYLRPGPCPGGVQPLGKEVLAGAGSEVLVSPAGIIVDGVAVPHSKPLLRDGAGRALPVLASRAYRLGRGAIWLFSPHPRSFDSRYFGPLGRDHVLGRLDPILLVSRDFRMRKSPWRSR